MKLSSPKLYGAVIFAVAAVSILLAQPTLKYSAQEQKNIAIATRELKDMLRG